MTELPSTDERAHLRADCSRCAVLCCVAPAFAASADFAVDKPAGCAAPTSSARTCAASTWERRTCWVQTCGLPTSVAPT